MTYRVYYSDVPLPQGQNEPNYTKLIPFGEATKDLALAKAMELIKHGAVVWRIEGPNDFLMGRDEIKKAYFTKTGKWPNT